MGKRQSSQVAAEVWYRDAPGKLHLKERPVYDAREGKAALGGRYWGAEHRVSLWRQLRLR